VWNGATFATLVSPGWSCVRPGAIRFYGQTKPFMGSGPLLGKASQPGFAYKRPDEVD
jgi:hypothetical protein